MSPLGILKLVGFATGAALHLYICWLIWNRRLGSRQGLTPPEQVFLMLGLCLGAWFLGNLLITFHELLLGRERLTGWLRAWDTVTMTGIALFPAAILHAHLTFYRAQSDSRVLTRQRLARIGVALYVPLIFLPACAYLINTGDYRPYLAKLRLFLIPYSIWYLLSVWASAALDWMMKDRLDPRAVPERRFFGRLAALLAFNGVFEFIVVVLRRPDPNDYPWVAFILLSLLPTFFVAYHVYRYRIVDVAVRDSIVYAAFALVFIAVYTYGVRRVDQFLVDRYQVAAGVVEVILILGMVALTGPLVRVIDRMVHRLFAREFGLYRDVVRQVSAAAPGLGDLASVLRYSEDAIRRALELKSVRIVALSPSVVAGPELRLIRKLAGDGVEVIETDDDLLALGASAAYALKHEGRLTGMMIIGAEPQGLTSEKCAVLDVLAGQIAVEVESWGLVEEKIRLERELAQVERLATLGQMAAQVAHEVKNPLSSIKSIAQVMREEPELAGHDRDLGLIVGEIDRLNRTVSQLLAFSRPGRAEQEPVALAEILSSIALIFGGEARELGVEIVMETPPAIVVAGTHAGAMREALGNLVLNAVQSSERGGVVSIRPEVKVDENGAGFPPSASSAQSAARGVDDKEEKRWLVVAVRDEGAGVPTETQQRIFEPFYSTKSRGAGLGLAIVQRRALELGGRVEITSPLEKGRGSEFRLIAPLRGLELQNTGN